MYTLKFYFPRDKALDFGIVNSFSDYLPANIGPILGISTEFNEDDLPEMYVKKYISFSIDRDTPISDMEIDNLKCFCIQFKVDHIKIYKTVYDEDLIDV